MGPRTKDKRITARIVNIKEDQVSTFLWENKERYPIKEGLKAVLIPQGGAVRDLTKIHIQITDNRTLTIVNTQLRKGPANTKRPLLTSEEVTQEVDSREVKT